MHASRPDPVAFGRALPQGLGVNLLVADVAGATAFQCVAFGVRTLWREDDFAALEGFGALWMLHSDRSYRDHPLGRAAAGLPRGAGVELRLYGCDPDAAEARARDLGAVILHPAADKPHGLREAHILDPEGYVWAPSVPTR
jgi:predicted enzyme related to lactoylglutathione lyase